mmetsp:Transcript_117198/g.213234  ORF Transcript_117198/g.213234 Transcript_117198/m.213234 type:complete len:152 (-) Transcript_117198:26-481(-)
MVEEASAAAEMPSVEKENGWDFKDGLLKQASAALEKQIIEKSLRWASGDDRNGEELKVELKLAEQEMLLKAGVEGAVLKSGAEFTSTAERYIKSIEEAELQTLLADVKEVKYWEDRWSGAIGSEGCRINNYHAVLPWGQYIRLSQIQTISR